MYFFEICHADKENYFYSTLQNLSYFWHLRCGSKLFKVFQFYHNSWKTEKIKILILITVSSNGFGSRGGGKRSVIKIVVLEFSIQNAESPLNILLSEEWCKVVCRREAWVLTVLMSPSTSTHRRYEILAPGWRRFYKHSVLSISI